MATEFFATAARGLEPVLARELIQLGAGAVSIGRGGVAFQGDRRTLYRANVWLRTAIRVLQPILRTQATSPEELYEAVRSITWTDHLTLEHTFAIDANVRDSAITHSLYAAQRAKDAICDQFVAKTGKRPSVDLEAPMAKINLHLHANELTLSLDSSGESLHKRGYRPIQTRAPLNEALAAGLILLTGWNGSTPLVDPTCGSGTLLIEGAWIALRRPPGLTRKRFGFMGWLDYDVRVWTEVRDEARQGVLKQLRSPILGSDVRRDAVAMAGDNARAAGVGHLLRFEARDLRDWRPPSGPPGVIVCNPPYGERLGEEREVRALYRLLGEVFRQRCSGWTLWVFSGNPQLEDDMSVPPVERVPLYNGRIRCRWLKYDSTES